MPLHTKLKKLARILRCRQYSRALRMGVAAGVEHESLLRSMSCNTVVDIGANRGQFALVACRSFPEARIISFEPLEVPSRTFRNVFVGNKRVVLHQCAIGSRCGEAEIHISGRDDSSSLLPITNLQNTLYPGTSEISRQQVSIQTLESVLSDGDIEQPALLKIDVQGYELECLRGCVSLLPKFRYLYVECSFQELYSEQAMAGQVITFLNERGFELTGIFHPGYDKDGRSVDADFLFESRAQA